MTEEDLLREFIYYLEEIDYYHHFLGYIEEQEQYDIENVEQLLNEVKNEQSY